MNSTPDDPKIPESHSETLESGCESGFEANSEDILTNEERQKIYQACLRMITSPDELPYDAKYILKTLDCHKPLERFLYNTVFFYGKDELPLASLESEESGKSEEPDFFEKSAHLYYLHSMLNEKLDRAHFLRDNMRDDALLNCILSEAKKRKLAIPQNSGEYLKERIYQTFKKAKRFSEDGTIIPIILDVQYDNFDDYLKYLYTKDGNRIMKVSPNGLWKLLGLRRDKTFFDMRPTQNEVYILCVSLGLDYHVYDKLRKMLEKEFEEASDDGRKAKFRNSFQKKGFTNTKRDDIMRECLENMMSYLIFARSEAHGVEEFIPGILLKNVNQTLERFKEEPLTKEVPASPTTPKHRKVNL